MSNKHYLNHVESIWIISSHLDNSYIQNVQIYSYKQFGRSIPEAKTRKMIDKNVDRSLFIKLRTI